MTFGIDPSSIEFDRPERLWALVAPALLLALWAWQLRGRLSDRRHLGQRRLGGFGERIPRMGGLGYWLLLIAASALVMTALAGPRALISVSRTAGIDLIVLLDGSASMRVADVPGSRWRRATTFLRQLAESVSWKDDCLAVAVFAHIATPQVRLTRDPNTFLFFIDHLADEPPFRLEDDTTWDTNIESGLSWGMKLIEKDQHIHGTSPNAKAFVLLSDGQAWSGDAERAIAAARGRDIPVFVIGVGTSGGGLIPEPRPPASQPATPARILARLDRTSLNRIATSGGGKYFELDRQPDTATAAEIVGLVRRRAGSRGVQREVEDLHWQFLVAAAACVAAGVLFLRERAELALCAAGAGAALWLLTTMARG